MASISSLEPDIDTERRFGGLARLYGPQGLQRLHEAHVAVAGIGGVGSWCAEALARSGIGALTLIDLDQVAESNINRQLHALTQTIGQSKVDAMGQRIRQIHPHCRLTLIDDFVEPGNAEQLLGTGTGTGNWAGAGMDAGRDDTARTSADGMAGNDIDVLIDCTDQMSAKIAMIRFAASRRMPVVVCGGAGGKTDPLLLRAADLSRVCNDALLSKLRNTLRREYGYPRASDASGKALKRIPAMGVRCLWVDQPALLPQAWLAPRNDMQGEGAQDAPQGLSCAGYGSAVTVTASMGLAAANEAIQIVLQAR